MLNFKRSEKLSKDAKQIFIPVINGTVKPGEFSKLLHLDLQEQLVFFAPSDKPIKAGEIYEFPAKVENYS